MNTLGDNVIIQYLRLIKRIVSNENCIFKIVNRPKNKRFFNENNLSYNDVKKIILNLTVEDYLSGPEKDKDTSYEGWIFKFSPYYLDIKLYIKIRVEDQSKAICISIHEFGLNRKDGLNEKDRWLLL